MKNFYNDFTDAIVTLPGKAFVGGQRLSMGDDVPDFPILGLVQCSESVAAGSPVGPGFSKSVLIPSMSIQEIFLAVDLYFSYLCIAGVADPGGPFSSRIYFWY